jgi:hypothetical protein
MVLESCILIYFYNKLKYNKFINKPQLWELWILQIVYLVTLFCYCKSKLYNIQHSKFELHMHTQTHIIHCTIIFQAFCNRVTACRQVFKSTNFKVILLADSIRSQLLSWFGRLIIKKIPEYQPPIVYGYEKIWMNIV